MALEHCPLKFSSACSVIAARVERNDALAHKSGTGFSNEKHAMPGKTSKTKVE